MVHFSLKVSHCEKDSAVQSTASASLLHSLHPSVVHQAPLDSGTPHSAYFKSKADYHLQVWTPGFSFAVISDTSKVLKWKKKVNAHHSGEGRGRHELLKNRMFSVEKCVVNL